MVKFFQYLQTRTFKKNLIWALVFLVALFLFLYFGLRFYTRHNVTVAVPELKGMPVDDAVKLLRSQGFQYDIDSIYQVDVTPGLVVEQDPEANTRVKDNRTLYLTIITRSAPEVMFPDLIEKTFIEARATLSSYGLKLGDTSYIADIARDVVLDTKFGGQTINKGRPIPKGSIIDLVLGDGRGPNEITIPNLQGLTLEEVRFVLRGAALTLGTISYHGVVTDSLTAKVISQSPSTTENMVSIGTAINISLSN